MTASFAFLMPNAKTSVQACPRSPDKFSLGPISEQHSKLKPKTPCSKLSKTTTLCYTHARCPDKPAFLAAVQDTFLKQHNFTSDLHNHKPPL